MNNLPDVRDPLWFFIIAIIVYMVVVARYFLISGLFYLIFHKWEKQKWASKKINVKGYPKDQFRKEILRSNITAIIFGISGAALLLQWQAGYARVYETFRDYPLWWMPVSLVIALFLQETYYYWLHRWMHIPSVFRVVHRWHHDSHIASPWTAFSFHPLEGLIQALFLPMLLVFLPMHLYVFVFLLVIMSVSSVINHLDIEIYPDWFLQSKVGRFFIGATHHAKHHRYYKYNFGLYFSFWDRIAGSEKD
jgi:sterol desaturase/sphingolipid hydroxylase (fatty acid hydroxylase superfamily)